MVKKSPIPRASAFTLVEVLVSIAVLALLVALIGQLFTSTTTASTLSTTHLEADSRVRQLFARLAADFSHIVKRPDIDYYLKSPSYIGWPYVVAPATSAYQTSANLQPGNDLMAFFSQVSGYSSATDAENDVSLVAYRINNTGTAPCVERLGKALAWGGASTSILPLPFFPVTIAGTAPYPGNWPNVVVNPGPAITAGNYDQDYETICPNTFRFEYYYQLSDGTLSPTPWLATNSTLNGLKDVVGIGVVVAITDRKASAVASSTALQNLATQMQDFPALPLPANFTIGSLRQSWQNAVSSAPTTTLPLVVKDGIRVYEQLFPINTPAQ